MAISEVLMWLKAANIRPDAYDLSGGSVDEAYVLRPCGFGWEVFYSERGLQTGLRRFAAEDAACDYFRSLISGDPTTRAA